MSLLAEMLGRPAPTRDVEMGDALFSAASASEVSTIGPIRCAAAPARSITTSKSASLIRKA